MAEKTGKGYVPVDSIFVIVCPHVERGQYLLRSTPERRREKIRGCGRCKVMGRCDLLKKECLVNPQMRTIESFFDGVEMRPKKM